MRVSIAEIARQSGFAKSTVSIALRDDARLPLATRKQIAKVAARLGYLPDPELATMGANSWKWTPSSRSALIACLLDSRTLAKNVAQHYVNASEQRAKSLGYRYECLDIHRYKSAIGLEKALVRRGVRGVLVPPVFDRTFLAKFNWHRFAGVTCGMAYWQPPYHVVNADVFAAVTLAMEQTIAAGYRRIGAALFLHPETAEDDDRRLAAALLKFRQTAEDDVAIFTLKCSPDDRLAFRDWLAQTKPDAVVGLHTDVRDWMVEDGIRIPQDIAFATLADSDEPDTAHIDPQHAEIGRTAAEFLDLSIRLNQIGAPQKPRTILVEPTWSPGASLPPRI